MLINSIIALVVLTIYILSFPLIYPKIKGIMSKWYIWTGFSILWIAYNLYVYVSYVWMHGILGSYSIDSFVPIDAKVRMHYYTIFGDATFTSICGFVNFFIPIFLIFNPSRKLVQQLAPITFWAGLAVTIAYFNGDNFKSAYYIFIGNNGSAMRHMLMMVVGYTLMFCTPKFVFKSKKFWQTDWWFTVIVFSIFIIYIFLMSNLLRLWIPESRLYYNCSGCYPQDWTSDGMLFFLGNLHNLYPFNTIVFWILVFGSSFATQLIWNRIKDISRFEYKVPKYFYLHKIYVKRKWWYW